MGWVGWPRGASGGGTAVQSHGTTRSDTRGATCTTWAANGRSRSQGRWDAMRRHRNPKGGPGGAGDRYFDRVRKGRPGMPPGGARSIRIERDAGVDGTVVAKRKRPVKADIREKDGKCNKLMPRTKWRPWHSRRRWEKTTALAKLGDAGEIRLPMQPPAPARARPAISANCGPGPDGRKILGSSPRGFTLRSRGNLIFSGVVGRLRIERPRAGQGPPGYLFWTGKRTDAASLAGVGTQPDEYVDGRHWLRVSPGPSRGQMGSASWRGVHSFCGRGHPATRVGRGREKSWTPTFAVSRRGGV